MKIISFFLIFLIATSVYAGKIFTNEDLKRYKTPVSQDNKANYNKEIKEICTKSLKPGLLTEYEINNLIRESEYIQRFLDITSKQYELLQACHKVLLIEKEKRQAKHEELTGTPLQKVVEKYDQDYWCRWGNYYREEVERAKRRVERAKKEFEEIRSKYLLKEESEFSLELAKQELQFAQDALEEAEEDLRHFEDRAYRQDIPASWYRCQYE